MISILTKPEVPVGRGFSTGVLIGRDKNGSRHARVGRVQFATPSTGRTVSVCDFAPFQKTHSKYHARQRHRTPVIAYR